MAQERELWKTHWGMIFAMIGTEVGLGNIWRFPYLVGKYGITTKECVKLHIYNNRRFQI